MSRRKELRVKAVLPVKVTGVDASARHFSLMCHTLDLTYNSARIAGVRASLMQGQPSSSIASASKPSSKCIGSTPEAAKGNPGSKLWKWISRSGA